MWFKQLDNLEKVKIPRWLRLGKEEQVFSFSLHAYGVVVYAKVVYYSGKQSCRLIAAKTKVAPLKATSIPRLELMAAVLGARLTNSIIDVLRVNPDHVTY